MSALSLTDVMNALADGRVLPVAFERGSPEPLSELDAFIALDPLLASLNRHYITARRHHKAARKEYGIDSPMADVAADMEDSAWCAMQTRLMELRARGDLMRLVQKKIRDSERVAEQARQDEKDKKALAFFHRMETARLIREKNKSSAIYEWLAVLIILHQSWRLPFPGIEPQRIAA